MGGFKIQRDFHRVHEHPKIGSDEEVMAVQSLRTKQENLVGRTSRGLRFYFILGHHLSSSCIKLYMEGF